MPSKTKWIAPLAMGLLVATALPVYAAGEHKGKGHGAYAEDDHWTAPPEQARRQNPIPKGAASIARGKKIYAEQCASCHGVGGRGDGPAGKALTPMPADLVAMAPQHSAGDLAWKVETGRGPMPPWKGVLSTNQIWDVVNYMQSLGAKAKPKSGATQSKDGHAGHAH